MPVLYYEERRRGRKLHLINSVPFARESEVLMKRIKKLLLQGNRCKLIS